MVRVRSAADRAPAAFAGCRDATAGFGRSGHAPGAAGCGRGAAARMADQPPSWPPAVACSSGAIRYVPVLAVVVRPSDATRWASDLVWNGMTVR